MDIVRRLAAVSANISMGRPLVGTLKAVADGVVDGLGFGVAVVNFVLPDGSLEVAAVAGPPEVREALQGQIVPRPVVDDLLERSEAWGSLRFVPAASQDEPRSFEWIPAIPEPVDPQGWHPHDSLFGPMYSHSGELIGVLSVDLPPEGRRPSPLLCEMLQIFTVQSGIAIENALLLEDVERERDRLAAGTSAFRFFFGAAGPMATIGLGGGQPGRILMVNDAVARLLGRSKERLLGRNGFELIPPGDREQVVEFLTGWPPGQDLRADCRLVRGDGTVIWVRVSGAAVNYPTRWSPVLIMHLDDITERKAREESLTVMANVDPLTGLPNRRALHSYLEAVLSSTGSEQESGGVLIYADLDRFKRVNDEYGHAVGDEVLKSVAARLTSLLRTCDLVARIGGDEFAIVAPGLDVAGAKLVIDRVKDAFEDPLPGHPEGGAVSISLGAASLDEHFECAAGEAAESVIHQADMAMYQDKRAAG